MTAPLLPPGASELTRPFWEAASRRTLVRPVCDACGHNFFVPQLACPRCHAETWSYHSSSGRGTLSTFTVVHRAPTADHAPPYVVGIIDLDEGWYMMSNVVGCAPDAVAIGQRVEVVFETRPDGVVLPRFRPCTEGKA
jgi:uncharacterized OB-fold protein